MSREPNRDRAALNSHSADERRFTVGLIADVFDVLERHGYRRPADPRVTGTAVGDLFRLVETFEGKRHPHPPGDTQS